MGWEGPGKRKKKRKVKTGVSPISYCEEKRTEKGGWNDAFKKPIGKNNKAELHS